MAILKDPKDPQGLMAALGPGALGMSSSEENLIGDEPTNNESFDDVKSEISTNRKLPLLTSLKKAGEAGGKALTSQEALGTMRQIGTIVTQETQNIQKVIMSNFRPIDEELSRTIELLSSPNLDAQDEALDRIEDIRKALGVDFDKIATEMGDNVKDLIAGREFQREDNRKKEALTEKVKQERLQVRDELRERGINTYLDEKTNILRVKTFKEEKEFKQKIFSDEKEIIERTEKNNILENKLRKQETLTLEEEQLLITNKKKDAEDLKLIEKRKEEANIKPGQQFSGFFSQTFGQAGIGLKQTFGEIGQMGKGLVKGLMNAPGQLIKFGAGLGKAVLALIPFILKGLLIGLVIGIVVISLFKLYSSIKRVIDKISNFFSFGKKKETETADVSEGDLNKASSSAVTSSGDKITNNSISEPQSNVTNVNNALNNTAEENKITNQDYETQSLIPGVTPITSQRIQPITRQMNVNRMSADLAATRETKSGSNVIAPSSSTNVVNNNTTQQMTMLPANQDRSFINLNTVPI